MCVKPALRGGQQENVSVQTAITCLPSGGFVTAEKMFSEHSGRSLGWHGREESFHAALLCLSSLMITPRLTDPPSDPSLENEDPEQWVPPFPGAGRLWPLSLFSGLENPSTLSHLIVSEERRTLLNFL